MDYKTNISALHASHNSISVYLPNRMLPYSTTIGGLTVPATDGCIANPAGELISIHL